MMRYFFCYFMFIRFLRKSLANLTSNTLAWVKKHWALDLYIAYHFEMCCTFENYVSLYVFGTGKTATPFITTALVNLNRLCRIFLIFFVGQTRNFTSIPK